ncbi:META domain-containing protein [Saccharospirillum alexandrii]|uniref:META domain-containing protein n=1 Tax=Saccharospirillum alexandrii TaxID=2448477 RepID=UPI00173E28BF
MILTRLPKGAWRVAACLLLVASVNAGDTGITTTPAESTIDTRRAETQSAHRLIGRVFQWQYGLNEDGTRVQPDTPGRYLLRFNSEGRISLKADCNNYAASVRLTDTVFSTGPMIGTRALCPKGSLERPYVNAIESAAQWSFDGEQLMLRQPHDGGVSVFIAVSEDESEGNGERN